MSDLKLLSRYFIGKGHKGIFIQTKSYLCLFTARSEKKCVCFFSVNYEKSVHFLAINFVPLSDLKFIFWYKTREKSSYLLAKKEV